MSFAEDDCASWAPFQRRSDKMKVVDYDEEVVVVDDDYCYDDF